MKTTPRRRRQQRPKGPEPAPTGRSQPLILPASKFTLLTEAQVEQIHEASLSILSRTGVVFNEEEAVGYFRQAGAGVADNRVYLERDFVERCLATAPAQYTLHARNPANSVTIGGNHCAVMPGGAPARWPTWRISPG